MLYTRTAHALDIHIKGTAWGMFKGTYSHCLKLANAEDVGPTVKAFEGPEGYKRLLAMFPDFAALHEARIYHVTSEDTHGPGYTRHCQTTRVVKGWGKRKL